MIRTEIRIGRFSLLATIADNAGSYTASLLICDNNGVSHSHEALGVFKSQDDACRFAMEYGLEKIHASIGGIQR
jgi:hypothetical protein